MSASYIPDELIVEILKKLPPKALLRFMSVSETWYSLIKNPTFISYHSNHQINHAPTYLLYRNGDSYDYYVYSDNENFDMHLKFNNDYYEHTLRCSRINCCNGIVCFKNNPYRKVKDISFVLWNVFIRKSLYLKVPHRPLSNGENSACWFGFDEVSKDYKLVWVGYSTTPSREIRPFGVYIYSLNERSWRCVNASFSLKEGLLGCSGLYLNGVIHWVFDRSYSYDFYSLQFMPELILTFSLADETFGVCNLPSEIVYVEPSQDYTGPDDVVGLMTMKRGCKNCLVVVHCDMINLNYWVMEEEGRHESWVKYFSIINTDRNTRVLNARMNGEIVMYSESGGVVSLDHRLMRMNLLSSVTSEYPDYAGTYMENLVLLV